MPAANKKNMLPIGSSSSFVANAPTSRKRKIDGPKFYAVRFGAKPGVYMTWAECQAQTAGYKGATYKSFPTRKEAELFVAGKDPNPKPTTDRFYAVAIGSKPGVYTDWLEAQRAYMGVKGPKYKKFTTRWEAEDYVRTFGNGREAVFALQDEDDDEEEDYDDEDILQVLAAADEEPAKKRTKTAAGAVAKGSGSAAASSKEVLSVYTDGSSLSNGKVGAAAGVGVWFGHGDPRNISERLQGEVQTNQRAELTAILRALEVVPSTQSLQLFSDSKYAISCVTEWYASWEKNGWRTREGPVKNQDLVKATRARLDERTRRGAQTLFKWVKGHASTAGNVAADQLAVQGARKR